MASASRLHNEYKDQDEDSAGFYFFSLARLATAPTKVVTRRVPCPRPAAQFQSMLFRSNKLLGTGGRETPTTPDPPRVHVEVVLTPESRHSDIRPVKRGVHVRRLLRGPRCLRSRKLFATRGLNEDHNHELKNIFKGAATTASARPGPFHDFYAAFSPWRARSRRSL